MNNIDSILRKITDNNIIYNNIYDYNNNNIITKRIIDIDNYSYNNNSLLVLKATSNSRIPSEYIHRIIVRFGEVGFVKKYFKFLDKLYDYNQKEFEKIVSCRTENILLSCKNGHGFEVKGRCNSKYCPLCSLSRSWKNRTVLKSFLKHSPENLPLRFFTLTWKNTKYLNRDLRKKYSSDFKNFKQKLARIGYKIHKGIKSLEIKYDENSGYNAHLHLLVYASYTPRDGHLDKMEFFQKHGMGDGFISKRYLSSLWMSITKDSYIVDTQLIRKGIRGGVNYLCKYISKFENVYNLDELREYDEFTKNLRVIEKFGFLKNEVLSKHKLACLCPICGKRVTMSFYQEITEIIDDRIICMPLIDIPLSEKNFMELI